MAKDKYSGVGTTGIIIVLQLILNHYRFVNQNDSSTKKNLQHVYRYHSFLFFIYMVTAPMTSWNQDQKWYLYNAYVQ